MKTSNRPEPNPVRRGAKGGFTIVEAMTGIAVLAVCFAAIYTGFGRGFALASAARDDTYVGQILQSEIENLRTSSWSDIVALGRVSDFKPGFTAPGLNMSSFDCKRIIWDRRGTQKAILLVVRWTDAKGSQHERQYMTLFTRGGLNDYYTRSF